MARRLPFDADVMMCQGSEILQLASADPFAGQPSGPKFLHFVSVMAKRKQSLPRVPVVIPSARDWGLKILDVRGPVCSGPVPTRDESHRLPRSARKDPGRACHDAQLDHNPQDRPDAGGVIVCAKEYSRDENETDWRAAVDCGCRGRARVGRAGRCEEGICHRADRCQQPAEYGEYAKRSPDIIAKYGGRFIARAGRTVTLEGPAARSRVVIIEYPSFERAQAWFNSPEYQQAKKLREGAANAQFIVVEGQ